MDSWATSNRLGDIGGNIYDEINEKNVLNSLEHGPPMRVKIVPDSIYYKGIPSNPKDVVGTVVGFSSGEEHPIRVKWDNGYSNNYRYKDLIIVN